MESMAGIRLEQRLTTSRPMVITQQLETEDNLPINKGTGGLEDTRTDPLRRDWPEIFKETGPGVLSPLRSLVSGDGEFRFLSAVAVIYKLFAQSWSLTIRYRHAVNENFTKISTFLRWLNSLHMSSLNFAKSCILTCLSQFDSKTWRSPSSF